MTELNEDILKGIHDGIKAVQEDLDGVKGKVSTLEEDKLDKVSKSVEELTNQIHEEKAAEKFKAQSERMDEIERAIIEGKSGDVDASQEEYKQALHGYLRKGTELDEETLTANVRHFVEKNVYGVDDNKIDMMTKELVAGSGPDGGYFLTADRSSMMVERIFETSPLRGLANMVTTTSDLWEFVYDDDEADAGWVGEVDDRPTTDTPQVGVGKIPVHEIYAQPRATQKMIDDAGFNIEAWLSMKVADRIGRRENEAFVNGTGSQRPKGFLTYAATPAAGSVPGYENYQRNTLGQLPTGTDGTFDADNLIQLKNTLFEEYQGNSTFAMDRQTFTTVMQLKDNDGQYLLNPQIVMQGGDKMLLGSNVVFLNDMPVAATDSLSIMVADFAQLYTIVDRFDIRVLRDPYTQKPYVRYYTTKRTGGAVTNFQAGKILRLGS